MQRLKFEISRLPRTLFVCSSVNVPFVLSPAFQRVSSRLVSDSDLQTIIKIPLLLPEALGLRLSAGRLPASQNIHQIYYHRVRHLNPAPALQPFGPRQALSCSGSKDCQTLLFIPNHRL